MKPVVLGTRGSKLALIQTEQVIRELKAQYPSSEFRIRTVSTSGDKSSEAPLKSLGLGIFVKELEEALIRKEIDMAVHSLKDLTPELPKTLTIGAVCQRQDPRDVLINKWNRDLSDLPLGARIGTSSPRRTAQLKAQRPDLKTLPVRGNVETRIRKARSEDYDGVLLAAAGVTRLGLQHQIAQYLSIAEFIPAPGQGALAVEIRQEDEDMTFMTMTLDHTPTRKAVTAERAFLQRLGDGCQEPSAAYAEVNGESIVMHAFMASQDGQHVFTTKAVGVSTNPHEIAMKAHQQLIDKGAHILL